MAHSRLHMLGFDLFSLLKTLYLSRPCSPSLKSDGHAGYIYVIKLIMCQPRTQALSSMRRKDPGRGWSRGSQILGAKLKFRQGRGSRGVYCLYLKNCNCVFDSDDKIHICDTKLEMEELSKIRICLYGTTSRVE